MRFCFLVFLCCVCGYTQRITKIAHDYLPVGQDRLVVSGTATEAIGMRLDTIVTFKINSVFWGKLNSREINIIYPYTDVPNILNVAPKIVIIQKMKSLSNFLIIEEFSNDDSQAQQKIESLEKLLAIEKLPESLAKEKHFEYCIDGFKSNENWYRWNSFWEWEYIVNSRLNEISQKMLSEVLASYVFIPEISLKKRLRETIITVKRSANKNLSLTETSNQSNEEEIEKALAKLQQDDLNKQLEAVQTIAQYPGTLTHQILLDNIKHSSVHMRCVVLFHLRTHAIPSDIPAIINILQNDSSLRVRSNAIETLTCLGATEAIPEIKKYLDIKYTQRIAQKALDLLNK